MMKTEYYEIVVYFNDGNTETFNCWNPEDDFTQDDNTLTIDTMEGPEILLSLFNIKYIKIQKARQTVDPDKIKIPTKNDEVI